MKSPKTPLIRDHAVTRLMEDILGPQKIDEVLNSRPSDTYLTGLIWPTEEIVEMDGDSEEALDDANDDFSSIAAGQHKPSAFGVSFAIPNSAKSGVSAVLEFGSYDKQVPEENSPELNGKAWQRTQRRVEFQLAFDDKDILDFDIYSDPISGLNLKVYARSEVNGDLNVISINIYNNSRKPSGSDIPEGESRIAFQTQLVICFDDKNGFLEQSQNPGFGDSEQLSNKLLFRNKKSYATGSQCSVEWDEDLAVVSELRTTWLPTQVIPTFSTSGDEVFSKLVNSGRLAAKWLSEADTKEISETLNELCDSYDSWIKDAEKESKLLNPEQQNVSQSNLNECKIALGRMRAGVNTISSDPLIASAFQYANMAMHLQHSWKTDSNYDLSWRPFQIGFVLLCLESLANEKSIDRDYFDLLWFPTGGGKTEAYLGLIAFASWLRYLRDNNKGPTGNVAIMRYTLRLLTAQQFLRASSLMLACEYIHRELFPTVATNQPIFSIGLWVGGAATPTTFQEIITSSAQEDAAKQILECPCCQSRLIWKKDRIARQFRPSCENPNCDLGSKIGSFGICTIDEDIYETRPTLVIGTIDKFAQLPFQPKMKRLFDLKGQRPTELVIQDELHLISGPLGSIAGLYETALDWLLEHEGNKPKIIGSTATIRRATQQIRSLFDRNSFQFPPPGIDHENSGFAVVDTDKPGRLYVGLTTAGRSAKFSIQAALGSIAQSAKILTDEYSEKADGYLTALVYYNSLRELGGGVVQAQDDVPDAILSYAARRNETPRQVRAPLELTSRVSQQEINETLNALEKPNGLGGSPDFVLATNMVSVGVDVPRLGLMVLQGTPKARSEYIQASSRVGRSDMSPGLVLCVFNASKARDRSSFESFITWHRSIYAQVETTGVTPFASRARDKALHAALVGMVRHSIEGMLEKPDSNLIIEENIQPIFEFIKNRVTRVSPRDLDETLDQLEELLDDWISRSPSEYKNPRKIGDSLMQAAEAYAQRLAQGRFPEEAWATLNSMRSVEASTKFRLVEHLSTLFGDSSGHDSPPRKSWRRPSK